MEDVNFLQIGLGVLGFILLIWCIYLSVRLTKLNKRFNVFTKGANITNLEDLIQEYTLEAKEMKTNISNNSKVIDENKNKIVHLKGNVEVLRYNAFQEIGQDLSFSIAFLDDNKNGVVISSIYNRGVSSVYAKPVNDGKSSYKLSEEELIVIERSKSIQK